MHRPSCDLGDGVQLFAFNATPLIRLVETSMSTSRIVLAPGWWSR